MTTGATIVFAASNSEDLLNYLNTNTVDVLFLDIDLNSTLNGIEMEYIVSAYECKTFDFIHKPFNISTLEKTINRLSEDIRNNSTKFLNLNNNKQLVNQTLVNFIEKSGAKTVFNLTTGIVETYGSFNKIFLGLPKTPPNSFCFIGGKYRKNFMEVINNYGNFK